MTRPSYLRPYGRQPQIFQPQDPLQDRLGRATAGPGPAPSVPGVLGQDPRELMHDTFTENLGAMGRAQATQAPGMAPRKRGLGSRLADALTLVGAGDLPESDPYDPNFLGSFITSGLRAFSDARSMPGLMSRQQAREQALASRQAAETDLARARAEYFRGQAARPAAQPSAGRRPLSEEIQLEDVRAGHLMDRLREAARLRPPPRTSAVMGAGASAGAPAITPAERLVEGRYRGALRAGQAAVTAEQRRRASSLSRDLPLTPQEEERLRGTTRHEIDPSFSADSAAVVNQINPRLLGQPGFGDVESGSSSTARILWRLRGATRSLGPMGTSDQLAAQATLEEDVGVPETLDPAELEAAAARVARLGDDDARNELEASGYTDEEIDAILAQR